MTAEEKGKCSTVFRGGDTKASLYSWEWEQEVCRLILNTSLILACKHPFITHECDGETWDSVSVEESSASRADWSDWSDGRVTACSGLCAEKLFVCWHTLNYFIVAHFHSISIVLIMKILFFVWAIKKKKKLLPCLILLFLESVPSYCSSLWYSAFLCNTIFIALWCYFFIRWQQNYPGHQLTFTVTRLL